MLASIAVLVGCGEETPCPAECEDGFVCDRNAGECRPKSLDRYDGTPPGRGLEIAATTSTIHLAAIDPERNRVLVGTIDGSDPRFRVLTELEEPASTELAVAARDGEVSVAWRNGRGDYRIADREDDRWRLRSAVELADQPYRATRHVDLAIDAEGRRHLVFYDRASGAPHRLVRSTEGDWTLEQVDDGSSLEHARCSSTAESEGVGFDPDLVAADGELLAAYYDARCDDLHLARYSGGAWRIAVVDEGRSLAAAPVSTYGTARDVGRFPSLAIDARGNPAVAYVDTARGQLRFARRTENGFDVQLVDPGVSLGELSQRRKQLVGTHAALAFDGNAPRILYLDGTSVRLRYAYRARDASGGNRWLHRTLDPRPPVGFHAALTFSDRGPVGMAERLRPTEEGLTSELVMLRGESL